MPHSVRTIIFNKAGSAIAEIDPEYKSVIWRLNNTGVATFGLSYADPKCTPENLASGNRILIQFENGLPDFAGVLDYPLTQELFGVSCTAYTGERILKWRVTEKSRYWASESPGFIFRDLIQAANGQHTTGITLGTIEGGGTVRSEEYHLDNLLAVVLEMSEQSGQDFHISSSYSVGRISFFANWYEQRGANRSGEVYLVEDRNVAQVVLDRQGLVASRVHVVGAGQTWGDERIDAIVDDSAAQAEFDYREYAEVQTRVDSAETLEANAAELLAEVKRPSRKVTLAVLDGEPAPFASYDVGDIVTLQAFLLANAWAFDGTVRVTGREWRSDNTCRLEVEGWD